MKLLGIAYENKTLYIGFLIVSFEITIGKKKESVTYGALNDEEIDYCWTHSHGNTDWTKKKAFARAILRKAQEK